MSKQYHGRFCWHEILVNDLQAAKDFYCTIAGWTAAPAHVDGYTLLKAGDREVAGLMALPKEAAEQGARPGWIGYIFVDDVDARATEAQQKGAAVLQPPQDIPEVGRFAVLSDPQGAVFALFNSAREDAPPPRETPGQIGWNELTTTDWPAAWSFYSEMFGWEKDEAMDMGEMGTYQLIARNGEAFGAMMNAQNPELPPAWLFYINVDSVEAAKARVEQAGGQVLHGPMEVPDGSWILVGQDSQGLLFALVGQR